MLSKEYEKKLDEEYELLNSKESIDYTKKILLEMGKSIQKYFPGVDFDLKARLKSPKSFEGKKDRMRRSQEEEKPIYDNIGFCLIVKHVADKFGFKQLLCDSLVNARIKLGQEIDNEKSSQWLIETNDKIIETIHDGNKAEEKVRKLEARLQEYKKKKEKLKEEFAKISKTKDEDYIELLEASIKLIENLIKDSEESIEIAKEGIIDREKLVDLVNEQKEKLGEKSEKIIAIGEEYYEYVDNTINERMSVFIMNELIKNNLFMNSLKLKKIPGRTKIHDGGKSGYYVAFHDAIKSKTLKYLMIDLHAMAYGNYKVSKLDHSQGEGKERIFPRLGIPNFRETVLEMAPKNIIYQQGKYENGKEIKPGKIYECSDIENVIYFFTETLEMNKDTFKYVISDKSLFSGKGKKISENNNGELEEEIIEDGMER